WQPNWQPFILKLRRRPRRRRRSWWRCTQGPRFSSSGVFWRPGVIVTAEHTIRREEEITVTLPDGTNVPATLAGTDPGTDIAALRVEAATQTMGVTTRRARARHPGPHYRAGTLRKLFDAPRAIAFDVTPDGQRFLVAESLGGFAG